MRPLRTWVPLTFLLAALTGLACESFSEEKGGLGQACTKEGTCNVAGLVCYLGVCHEKGSECEPNAAEACTCDDRRKGRRTCSGLGDQWGACENCACPSEFPFYCDYGTTGSDCYGCFSVPGDCASAIRCGETCTIPMTEGGVCTCDSQNVARCCEADHPYYCEIPEAFAEDCGSCWEEEPNCESLMACGDNKCAMCRAGQENHCDTALGENFCCASGALYCSSADVSDDDCAGCFGDGSTDLSGFSCANAVKCSDKVCHICRENSAFDCSVEKCVDSRCTADQPYYCDVPSECASCSDAPRNCDSLTYCEGNNCAMCPAGGASHCDSQMDKLFCCGSDFPNFCDSSEAGSECAGCFSGSGANACSTAVKCSSDGHCHICASGYYYSCEESKCVSSRKSDVPAPEAGVLQTALPPVPSYELTRHPGQ